jgi:hypothetical protein
MLAVGETVSSEVTLGMAWGFASASIGGIIGAAVGGTSINLNHTAAGGKQGGDLIAAGTHTTIRIGTKRKFT